MKDECPEDCMYYHCCNVEKIQNCAIYQLGKKRKNGKKNKKI